MVNDMIVEDITSRYHGRVWFILHDVNMKEVCNHREQRG